jgi:A/G-specific adenine glycosylase
MNLKAFQKTVSDFYQQHGRHSLPWRKTRDPYKILVSEIMLQQTQVERVLPKYAEFLKKFPTVKALAAAPTKDVLLLWQGLGYNRRAINLQRAAQMVVNEWKSKWPQDLETLLKLPGVGRATAGDLLAFAWNKPAIVTETNIRTVYMHHFFPALEEKRLQAGLPCKIHDDEIIPLLEKTLDHTNPRDFYYALMDYGTHLKKTRGNNIARSAHHSKQSTFKGSNRELRSTILKLILAKPRTESELHKLLSFEASAITKNILALEKEGLIKNKKGRLSA